MTRSGLIVLLGLSMLLSSVALADYRSGRHDEHYRSHSSERYGESHHSHQYAYKGYRHHSRAYRRDFDDYAYGGYRRPSVMPYWRYGYTPRGPVITYRPYTWSYPGYAYRSYPDYAYRYRTYPYRAYRHRDRDDDYDD